MLEIPRKVWKTKSLSEILAGLAGLAGPAGPAGLDQEKDRCILRVHRKYNFLRTTYRIHYSVSILTNLWKFLQNRGNSYKPLEILTNRWKFLQLVIIAIYASSLQQIHIAKHPADSRPRFRFLQNEGCLRYPT